MFHKEVLNLSLGGHIEVNTLHGHKGTIILQFDSLYDSI